MVEMSRPRAAKNTVHCKLVCGNAATNTLHGLVCALTGGSRGIGKAISQELARNGAVVYVTGRSTPKEQRDPILGGSVDETAAGLARLGGTGVAVHVDHAQLAESQSFTKLIEQQHGKCDCLVNNAVSVPTPDAVFFGSTMWEQPLRFLDEQVAVGSYNHACQVLLMLPYLRRGKGLVVNISSWGAQTNIPSFPASYLVSKHSLDSTTVALNQILRKQYHISMIALWPGSVRSERAVVGAKRSKNATVARLGDCESARFTGRAVVAMLNMDSEEMARHFQRTTHVVADFNMMATGGHDLDGYIHEKGCLPHYSRGDISSSAMDFSLVPKTMM